MSHTQTLPGPNIAIIQARMTSSRLPGKVLREIAGEPMLVHVVERARRATTLDEVGVATTTDPSDDGVVALCAERAIPCYRGSLYDVLDRYTQAARVWDAEVVVRLTADCPLIDPGVIDYTVRAFLGEGSTAPGAYPYDFAANRLPQPWGRTYPIGLDVEVCTSAALERAWQEASLPHHREHVMPYFYDGWTALPEEQPLRALQVVPHPVFRVLHVNHNDGLDHRQDYGVMRWTVDTAEDLELVRQIFARFPGRNDFSWLEVLALFEREPELARINAQVAHKDYRDVDARRKS